MVELVDVSGWTGGAIDWNAVAASGVSGAYVKVTQGTEYTSPLFLAQWIGARSAGLRVGAYHFLSHDTDPAEQAAHFLKAYDDVVQRDVMVPALDVETAWLGGDPKCADAAATWLDKVSKALGVLPRLYTYAAFARAFRSRPELARYPLWLARYSAHDTWPPAPAPWTEVDLWQYSGTGHVPGIAGNADRSRSMR